MPTTAPHDLRGFIDLLESRGELRRITAPVSADLEITEITDRVCKSPGGGQALLFENVDGQADPRPHQRLRLRPPHGLGPGRGGRSTTWATALARLVKPQLPGPLLDKMRRGLEASEVLRYAPRPVRRAPCQEVVRTGDDASLAGLPILRCWPGDPAPFITLPAGHHPGPGGRPPQRRHVPPAGLRRAHHRPALAHPQGRRRARPPGRGRRAPAGGRGPGPVAGGDLRRQLPPAARHRRDDRGRLAAARPACAW